MCESKRVKLKILQQQQPSKVLISDARNHNDDVDDDNDDDDDALKNDKGGLRFILSLILFFFPLLFQPFKRRRLNATSPGDSLSFSLLPWQARKHTHSLTRNSTYARNHSHTAFFSAGLGGFVCTFFSFCLTGGEGTRQRRYILWSSLGPYSSIKDERQPNIRP